MNILLNAIHVLEQQVPPRTISICTEINCQDQVAVKISNNGPDISAGISSRIFDPFFTTKPIGKGIGLGLFTSYQIITKNHGGTIECFSLPGEGTEFVITIPQKRQVKALLKTNEIAQ